LRIAIVGAGVAGSYLLNRLDGHQVECFEMRPQDKWYTVCAWGTSEPYISEMVKKAGFNFGDYVLHRGSKMTVDSPYGAFDLNLRGMVSYDKHRLCEDMLKGHTVHWGTHVKEVDGAFADFDLVVDATGMHRSLLPKVKNDLLVPCIEYQVRSSKIPWDDFYIKPYPGLSGYLWYFPLWDGTGHLGAGEVHGAYKGEIEAMLKKYDCEVIRKIGRPVRIMPPAYCLPFSQGKVVGVGESIGTVFPMLGEGIIPSMQCAEILIKNLDNLDAYQEEVLASTEIYTKGYRFVRSKIDGEFSVLKSFPSLLQVYRYLAGNEKRFGMQTKLGDLIKLSKI
jgi:flavin-dependent dehydrogenase